jgi:hypothetical protein
MEIGCHAVRFKKHLAGMCQKGLSELGEVHTAAPPPPEKCTSHLIFQSLNMATHRKLCHPELVSGSAKAATIRNGDKDFEPPEGDAWRFLHS